MFANQEKSFMSNFMSVEVAVVLIPAAAAYALALCHVRHAAFLPYFASPQVKKGELMIRSRSPMIYQNNNSATYFFNKE